MNLIFIPINNLGIILHVFAVAIIGEKFTPSSFVKLFNDTFSFRWVP